MNKILYIVGWGRSGTTNLYNILGSLDGFVSTGELSYFWERGLIEGRLCGCGRQMQECELWSKVLDKRFSGSEAVDPAEVVSWRHDELRVRHTRRILRAARDRSAEGPLAKYLAVAERLYQSVADVTGARVIVDSSKRPSDGAALLGMPSMSPFFLHMVRDPRAVAFSWKRPKAQKDAGGRKFMRSHNPASSSISWVGWNLAAEAVKDAAGEGRSMTLRYEEFVADPAGAVRAIASFVGERAGELPFSDRKTVRLSGNHTVSGNPSRFDSGPIKIRPDNEWVSAQSGVDRVLATAFALPLLRRYEYRLQPARY